MSNALRDAMNNLAAKFASTIIEAIRASSLAEILDVPLRAAPGRAPGRPRGSVSKAVTSTKAVVVVPAADAAPSGPSHRDRPRSTAEDAEVIAKFLRSPPGTTGEQARKTLGLEKNRWNTCVYRAIRDGKIRKEGERRSTMYWATS
jgi:hypothetical protein